MGLELYQSLAVIRQAQLPCIKWGTVDGFPNIWDWVKVRTRRSILVSPTVTLSLFGVGGVTRWDTSALTDKLDEEIKETRTSIHQELDCALATLKSRTTSIQASINADKSKLSRLSGDILKTKEEGEALINSFTDFTSTVKENFKSIIRMEETQMKKS